MDPLHILIYQPLFNLLVVLYNLLNNNLGLAIVALAIIFKLITIPISKTQAKMTSGNKEGMDKISEIQAKYKDDKEKLAEEMLKHQPAVLKSFGKGCLFSIIMLLVFLQLRQVVLDFSAIEKYDENGITSERNIGWKSFNKVAYSDSLKREDYAYVNPLFAKMNMGKTASEFVNGNLSQIIQTVTIPYLILALLVGVSQYILMKVSVNQVQTDSKSEKDAKQAEDAVIVKDSVTKEKMKKQMEIKQNKPDTSKADEKTEPELDTQNMATQLGAQMNLMFAAMTAITSLGFLGGAQFFPAGLSIFWTIYNIGSIIEKLIQNRKK